MDSPRAEKILSLHNPLLKSIRKAMQKGSRTEEGWIVAEGFHLLEEALGSGVEIGAVIGTEQGLSGVASLGVRVVELSDALFRDLSGMETPQGILTLVRTPEWNRDLLAAPGALLLVLDGVQDPGNAGTILRTAEAFGATAVIALRGTVDLANPKVVRASAGSLFRVPSFRLELADLPVPLYGASGSGHKLVGDVDWRPAAAIVIGSEGRGLTEAVKKQCELVRIPTAGVESLNAAIAATVFLYEASRQRGAVQ
jgi:TrmH family RNA methyltransferase